MSLARRASLLAVASCLVACSVHAKRPPEPYRPGDGPPDCNPIRALKADLIVTAVGSVAMALAQLGLSHKSDYESDQSDGIFLYVAGAAVAVPAGLSAVVGARRLAPCRRAKAMWRARTHSAVDFSAGSGQVSVSSGAVREDRRRELLLALASRTRMRTRLSADHLVLQAPESSTACIDLAWTSPVRELRADLASLGVTHAACSTGAFVVWAGEIARLPGSASDTRCTPSLVALATARTAPELVIAIRELRPSCRAKAIYRDARERQRAIEARRLRKRAQQQAAERARRRAAEERRDAERRRRAERFCPGPIAAFRAEADPLKKHALLENMPSDCRWLISKPADGAR